jgi:uncharacterized protein (DUF433 family)
MKLRPEKTRVLCREAPRPDAEDQNLQSDGDIIPGYPQALLSAFERAARESPSVSINPAIMDGQPCIAGTRIPVHSVLRAIEHYGSLEAAVKCYPHLTIPQVKDALYFAQTVLEPADGIETETTT